MLKENKRTLIITTILTLVPVIVGILFWNRLPDPMATHFDINNQPDGYSSKIVAVFGIPLLLTVILWVGAFVTSRDPRHQNISPKVFTRILWIIPLISLVSSCAVYPYNLGYKVDMNFFAGILVGVMFIAVGNYLPKSRQNYTVGIKIPWTLDNVENWNKTHRLAGYLWVAGGFVILLGTLTGWISTGMMVAVTAIMVIVPCAYSFYLHERKGL